MPRSVRNFWIDTSVDGRQTDIATGPRNKSGGFSINISQRDNGQVTTPLTIEGTARSDGKILLKVKYKGEIVVRHETER